MKKTYIAPVIIVTELDGETLMLTMSSEGLEGTSYGGTATGISADARGRRGNWGNLWE